MWTCLSLNIEIKEKEMENIAKSNILKKELLHTLI